MRTRQHKEPSILDALWLAEISTPAPNKATRSSNHDYEL